LFNLAVNFLAQICGTTVVLCSATQPCFERADHPIRNTDPYLIRDIVPYDKELWEPFHRTKIIDAGSLTLQEIPDFMIEQLDTVNSLLVVCNKKSEAAFLYRELRERGYPCFHLSASMCMAHRRETLDEMNKALKKLKDALKNGRKIERECKIICIATQVIEAGVDISFQCVIRLTAGLDSIIQSAGRCNRNGEEPNLASVYTVQCKGEDLRMLSDIQRAQTATINLLKEFQNHPGDFQNDLSSDQAVSYFYRRLYREMPGKFQDYMTKDKPSLFSLLSENEDYVEGETGFELNQAFREAGKLFQVFDDESEDVIVPYKGGAECIANLCSEKASRDPDYLQRCLGQAKPYTIAIFSYQKKQLMAQNGLYEICGGKVLALKKEFYDDKALGFVTDGAQNNYLEVWTL
jgi:CRISPR-associated endonuclease/helicase Cas3